MKQKSFKFKQKKMLVCGCLAMASIGLFPITVSATIPPAPEVQGVSHQVRKVKGTVIDDTGQPLIGVSVVISGTKKGTTTNMDGAFTIDVKSTDYLDFTYIGMQKQTVKVGDKKIINITMKSDDNALGEVTVVAFAKQKKESVVASITTIKPNELHVPSSNLTTAFAGRIAGIISYQRSGEPGQDNASFFVRGVTTFGYGNSPLILIDGVEMSSSDLARLNTDDIESFSIMKDANATALYGARGANGVIYVKTKEGKSGQTKVNFRAEGTISTAARDLELSDPVTYMRMYNEATQARDPFAILPFTTKKIEMTEKGTDPILYPTVDWRNFMFKKNTFNQRYNLNISGGGEKVQYYVAGQYSNDTGIMKDDKYNNFNNNININRYAVRSNTTMNFGKYTKATVRVSATFNDYKGPLNSGTDYYQMSLKASPVLFLPFYEKDESHKYAKHVLFGNYEKNALYLNPYARMVQGFKESKESTIVAQIELDQDFKFLLDGLKAHFMANFNRYSFFDSRRSIVPYYYQAARTGKGDLVLTGLNDETGREYLDYSGGDKSVSSSSYMEAQLSYAKTFGKIHDVSGMLVFTRRESLAPAGELQNALPHRNEGLSGRFTYGYDKKYFAEFNFGYNGSERFDKTHRFGFFPAIGLGYLISNEKFYPKSLKNVISMMKLKYTWGKVGNDNIGDSNDRFFYLSKVNPSNDGMGYTFGSDFNYHRAGVSISRYADPNITWEVATKQNWGIELTLFEDKVNIQADYYNEKRKKILMNRSYIPTTMGLQAAVRSNVGEASGSGFEFSIDTNNYITKDWWISSRCNFTYALGRFEKFEEPDYSATPWLAHKGQFISQNWGYIAERLFIDQYEVDNSPKQTFSTYGPGDIKYKDINGDGIINEKDRVPIGYPMSPKIIYGFGFSTGYKGFDLSAFFQGSACSSFWIDPVATAPFLETGDADYLSGTKHPNALMQVWADNHWTKENQNSYALCPKLSDQPVINNAQTSTWFMRDGSFLRFKTLEIGYTIPKKITQKIGVGSFRLYLSGNNLACWSKFKLWDPEMAGNGLGYPVQRVYNIGLNLNF